MRILKTIPIGELRRDPLYQRRIDKKRVDRIKANFDEDIVNPLKVNYREHEGKYYIIDGQHTFVALSELGKAEAECVVYMNLSREEEALKFIKFNDPKTHKPVTDRDMFDAGLIGQDEASVRIKILVENLGYELYSRDKHKGVHCTKSLKMIYEHHGEDMLTHVLELYNTIWKQYKMEELPLKSLARFCELFCEDLKDKAVRDRFIEKLSDISPETLKREAENTYHKTTPDAICQVLIDRYNSRLRQESRLKNLFG